MMIFNTPSPVQNIHDNLSKCFFLKEKIWISNEIPLKYFEFNRQNR